MTDKSMDDFDEDSFSVESDYAEPRDDGQAGPPADWPYPSWYNRTTGDWYWKGKLDPCPVVPLGMGAGVYYFVTRAGEIRAFTSAALHSTGGPNDLFVGELAWPNRHFTKWDLAKKAHVG